MSFLTVLSHGQNMRIVAWVALLSHNKGLTKWFLMQCIKGWSTLRVSSKREKPPPRVVYRFDRQDRNAKDFVKMRRTVKKTEKNSGKVIAEPERLQYFYRTKTYVFTKEF